MSYRFFAARVGARVLIRRVHLWLGLSVGGLFVLLGVTGSALVFYVEIDAALNPVAVEAATPAPGWESAVWDRALATARARWPERAGDWSFEVTGERGAIPARYYPAHGGHHAAREMVWFSADGERMLRAEPWGGYAMSWVYELHMHLLSGERGRLVAGWSGVAMLGLLATGVVAWWPRGRWRKALRFKRGAAPLRRMRDLHKLAGLGSAGLLLVLTGTGVLLALPDVKRVVLAPGAVSAPRSGAGLQRISVAQALAAARGAAPGARLAFIDVPGRSDGAFRMRVQARGDPHRRFPSSFVFVDRYSGRVLAVHDGRTGVAAWVRALHDGSVGGSPLRLLAVLIGLVPAMLFATGLLHWLRRRRAASTRIFS